MQQRLTMCRGRKNTSKNNQPTAAQCAPFYLAILIGCALKDFIATVVILPKYDNTLLHALCHDSVSGFDFRCAVQSSALCAGVVALLICSAGTVVAHFSIGLGERRHGQSKAVRPSVDRRGRRQDNLRSVVPGLHRFSSAERIAWFR